MLLCYTIFLLTSQPLLPSTKNSLNVNYALLEQTGCSGVLFSATFQEQAEQIRDSPMAPRLMELPSFDNIVASFSRSYSYDKTYQAIEDDSAVIIHSSGTTGMKGWKLTSLLQADNFQVSPNPST